LLGGPFSGTGRKWRVGDGNGWVKVKVEVEVEVKVEVVDRRSLVMDGFRI
jgi:hypothetical protein